MMSYLLFIGHDFVCILFVRALSRWSEVLFVSRTCVSRVSDWTRSGRIIGARAYSHSCPSLGRARAYRNARIGVVHVHACARRDRSHNNACVRVDRLMGRAAFCVLVASARSDGPVLMMMMMIMMHIEWDELMCGNGFTRCAVKAILYAFFLNVHNEKAVGLKSPVCCRLYSTGVSYKRGM